MNIYFAVVYGDGCIGVLNPMSAGTFEDATKAYNEDFAELLQLMSLGVFQIQSTKQILEQVTCWLLRHGASPVGMQEEVEFILATIIQLLTVELIA